MNVLDPDATFEVPLSCLTCRGRKGEEACPVCEGSGLATGGGTLVLGMPPHEVFRQFSSRMTGAIKDAKRRAIRVVADLRKRRDAGEEIKAEDVSEEAIEDLASSDMEFLAVDDQESINLIRWTLKGHRDMRFDDGREVPFSTKQETWMMWPFHVVSDETMGVYVRNRRLFLAVFADVYRFVMLSDEEKKRLPRHCLSASSPTTAAPAPDRRA